MSSEEIRRKATVKDVDGATVKRAVENHTGMVKALKDQIASQNKRIKGLEELLELQKVMLNDVQRERNRYMEEALHRDTIPTKILRGAVILAGMILACVIGRLIMR